MTDLDRARNEISEIDKQMALLFERRMKCSEVVAEFKKERGLPVKDLSREAELIAKNMTYIDDDVIAEYFSRFNQSVIDISCDYQTRLMSGLKVAYCGIKGAYAYVAAKSLFPSANLIACDNFASAYKSVEDGTNDMVVLPIENSYAGEVGNVLDLFYKGNLHINKVMNLKIAHNLLGVPGAKMDDIKTVVSHPQALSQCGKYIRSHGFETMEYTNTAMAAKHVMDMGDKSVATVASSETAKLYGMEVIDTEINDNPNNTTRFAVLSRVPNERVVASGKKSSAIENTIILFVVNNEAGALATALNIIGAHGYNMRNLKSRPMKDIQWNYFFFVELEGSINTEKGRDMMNALSTICAKLKVVGTYAD